MGELKVLSNGRILNLLNASDVGDDGDVLTREGAGIKFKPPSGGGGGGTWGSITGTLSAQTDLQAALDAKAPASSAILHQATVELTDAQIKALPTTGIEIVAAPGANKVLILARGFYMFNWTADYTNLSASSAWLQIVYDVHGGEGSGLRAPTNFFINNGASAVGWITTDLTLNDSVSSTLPCDRTGTSPDSVVDQPLVINALNAAGDYTGGNAANTLRVSLMYYILNTLTGVFE